jgi:hypothetical protein
VSTPERLSCGTSVSVTSVLFQAGGAVTVVVGAVRSILTAGALCTEPLVLPALSVAEALDVSPLPSPLMIVSTGLVVPDKASVAVQWTVTSPRYQPAAFGLVVGAPDSPGATLSMLMPPTVVLAALSALSVTEPVTDWFARLVVSVVGAEEDLTPDVASPGVKETVTSVLFQPFAFAAGVREPMIVGAVLSSLTTTEPVPVFPTLSVTVVDLVTVPSVVTVSADGETVLTPEPPASAPVQVTVTSDLFQPAPFGAGLNAPVAVGAVLSSVYAADWMPNVSPPLATHLPLPLKFFQAFVVYVTTPFPEPAVSQG